MGWISIQNMNYRGTKISAFTRFRHADTSQTEIENNIPVSGGKIELTDRIAICIFAKMLRTKDFDLMMKRVLC